MKLTIGHMAPYSRPWPLGCGPRGGSRQGAVLRLYDAEGRSACGECAPLPGFSKESLADISARFTSLFTPPSSLKNTCFTSFADISVWLDEQSLAPSLRHGMEQALLGLLAQTMGRSLEAATDVTAAAKPASHVLVSNIAGVHAALQGGAQSLKLKVGTLSPNEAVVWVKSARQAAGAHVEIRVDANQAYSFNDASRFLRDISGCAVAFVEEPLANPSPQAFRRLQAAIPFTLALDESVRDLEALNAMVERGVGDVLILKPMLLGGLSPTRRLAEAADKAGMKVVVTSTLDGPLAREHAFLCAASCPPRALLECGLHIHSSTPSGDWDCAPRVSRDAIPHPLMTAAAARPAHTALASSGLTFQQLRTRVADRAGDYRSVGVMEGDRVGLCLRATSTSVVDFWALTWLGAVPVLVDMNWTDDRAEAALASVEARWVDAEASDDSLPDPAAWVLDDPRVVVFTSGSTGAARPVTLTTRQIVFSALGQAARIGHHLDDRWLCVLPLHHVGGLSILLRGAFLGITVILQQRWDAESVTNAMNRGTFSILSLVPKMLQDLIDARSGDVFPTSLRVLLVGGAQASPSLLRAAKELRAPVALSWGMSETASQVATNIPGDYKNTLAPLAIAEVTSREARLSVRGPLVNGAYLGTQDEGSVDPHGRVKVIGRADRTLISGGENISVSLIERALLSHPGIGECAVVGQPDKVWGSRPWALVAPAPGTLAPGATEIRSYLAGRLRDFEVPDRIVHTAALPRNAMGKIVMEDLYELLANAPLKTDE